MSDILLQVSLKALIKNERGEYLFLKRVKPYEGETEARWDVPGGKLVPGESIYQALAREIYEETKLVLSSEPEIFDVRDILRVAGIHTVRLTFNVLLERYAPVVLDPLEHVEYTWLIPKEALALYHDTYLSPALLFL